MSLQQTLAFVLIAALPGFVMAWIGVGIMRRYAPKLGLLDHPGVRKVHSNPTPLGGGIGIWLGVLGTFTCLTIGLLLLVWNPVWAEQLPEWSRIHITGMVDRLPRLWLFMGCGTALAVLGFCDDVRGLSWQFRLGAEFVVAAVAVTWGQARLTAFIEVPAIGWMLSVAWIVMLINSFNMLDNMDALSGGIAAISSGMLATVLLLYPDPITHKPQLFVSGLLIVLAGSLLGFLCHNRPPARIFMGDAGSYFIGFIIGVATLLSTYANYSSEVHSVLTPLCVMAVPLYDLLTVIWIRVREGRSPFQADKSHFSHRLVELGMSKTQAVLTIYLTSATCGFGALLLHRVDRTGAIVVVLMILCMLSLVAILESSGRRNRKS